jgi:hypothetical protein
MAGTGTTPRLSMRETVQKKILDEVIGNPGNIFGLRIL